jgi:hypothetical protein
MRLLKLKAIFILNLVTLPITGYARGAESFKFYAPPFRQPSQEHHNSCRAYNAEICSAYKNVVENDKVFYAFAKPSHAHAQELQKFTWLMVIKALSFIENPDQDPQLISKTNDIGLMQIKLTTAQDMLNRQPELVYAHERRRSNTQQTLTESQLKIPSVNIHYAVAYLKYKWSLLFKELAKPQYNACRTKLKAHDYYKMLALSYHKGSIKISTTTCNTPDTPDSYAERFYNILSSEYDSPIVPYCGFNKSSANFCSK